MASMCARELLIAALAVLAAACTSPTQPSVVSIWSVKYSRVRPVTQAGSRVALIYSYPTPACARVRTPDCQAASGVIAGVHELLQIDATSFMDPLATLFVDVPVDTTIVMKVIDEAVDPTSYIGEQVYVDG